jgi:peptidoglycan/xylan/chitin deacetylase (PgdA/CDA1 family)
MNYSRLKQLLSKAIVPTFSKLPYRYWPRAIKGNFIPIFMLHRFECNDLKITGHSTELVENCFEFLRKNNFDIISLEKAVSLYGSKVILDRPTVAFTIDDGYRDQYEVGLDVFKKYDCPMTYFITTEMMNGKEWMWDSKLEFLFDESIRQNKIANFKKSMNLQEIDSSELLRRIVNTFKAFSYIEIGERISKLSMFLDIEIPLHPPEKFKYMNWGAVQHLEKSEMKIAPHSKFHYILSKQSNERSKNEILDSWEDIKTNVLNPTPIFCYPIGKIGDFGCREKITIKEAGMIAAVTAEPGSLSISREIDMFDIPRYSLPNNLTDFKQYVSWIEEYKNNFRRRK